MMSIISNHHLKWSIGQENFASRRLKKAVPHSGWPSSQFPTGASFLLHGHSLAHNHHLSSKELRPVFSGSMGNEMDPDDSENENKDEAKGVNSDKLRENLEKIVASDDSAFDGLDLATLIRQKYGRSYDVQLIKKEFMGRNFLALNVMWKYMEQRSFPLTEEEYILRLDDVANTLKCWGAVSHIRNSLASLKERPRIGKQAVLAAVRSSRDGNNFMKTLVNKGIYMWLCAVSIFIDMDESGGRANEWIYK